MAELRRRYVPPRQNSIEVMPGEEPFAATAEERRASPGSQALLRRIGEQEQERTTLAKARFEKSKLGLIPAEGEGEKARRRQHLVRQAAKHGVPQNVLAQQMQVEGLQPEEPKGPMVKTPYGDLPADVGFRYLPEEAKPKAATPSMKIYHHPKEKDVKMVDVRDPESIKDARAAGYRPGKLVTEKPLTEAARKVSAAITARGKVTGELKELTGLYGVLDAAGEIVSAEKSITSNVMAWAKASTPGQAVSKMTGTVAQSIRNRVNSMRPLLINDIRKASEMGAKGMDSEKELAFYLQAATNPKLDVQSNYAAIKVLDEAYGDGSFGGGGALDANALRRIFMESGGDEEKAIEYFGEMTAIGESLSGFIKTPSQQNIITVRNPTTGEMETWDTTAGRRTN